MLTFQQLHNVSEKDKTTKIKEKELTVEILLYFLELQSLQMEKAPLLPRRVSYKDIFSKTTVKIM